MRTNGILTVALVWLVAAAIATCTAQTETHKMESNANGGSTAASVTSTGQPQFQFRDRRYEIEPGDSFDLTFELTPEFNQAAVAVQPDGFVTLRGIGDIKVQGQTIPELTDTLRRAYGNILNSPLISISLKDFQKPYFIADGQVGHPGKYELRANTTLTEAIAIAGGFTDASKHSHVQLYRRVNTGWTFATVIDVKKMHAQGTLAEDPYLHPGDMLFVPKNQYSKIKSFLPTPGVNAFGTY